MDWGSLARGYGIYLDESQKRAQNEQIMALRAMEMKRQQQADQAGAGVGSTLNKMFQPPPAAQPQQQTPQPGQASVPMAPPGQDSDRMTTMPNRPPGVQWEPQNPTPQNAGLNLRGMNPQQAQQALQNIPDPMERQKALAALQRSQAPQQAPPYRSAATSPPQPAQAPQGGPGGPMAPPMPQAPQPAAGPAPAPQQQGMLERAISALREKDVPMEQWGAQLEQLKPYMDFENKEKLAYFKGQMDAQKLDLSRQRVEQGDTRLDQGQQKIDAAAQKARDEVATGNISHDTIDYYAEQSLSGDNSWQVGLARGKVGQKLIAAVKDRIPEMAKERGQTPQDAIGNKAELGATTGALKDRTKFIAAARQFARNMDSQISLVEKYMKPGLAGSVPAVNKWIQAGRKSIAGDPDVSALDTAIRGLAREHQRIVTGVTSNAQLHASAQATADELLNTAQTSEQVRAVLKVMKEEVDNSIKAGTDESTELKAGIGKIGKPATAGKAIDFNDLK